MSQPVNFSKKEQYLMCLGYLKAIDNLSTTVANSDESRQIVMTAINQKVIDMIYPEEDFEDGGMFAIQKAMHDFRLDDRIMGIMEEVTERLPKNPANFGSQEEMLSQLLQPIKDEDKYR
ncbi:hypothetical protein OAU44_00155 [bacterium]|nr:hypothetical protein [bacterium]